MIQELARPARSVKTSGQTPYFSQFSANLFYLPGHPGAGAARKFHASNSENLYIPPLFVPSLSPAVPGRPLRKPVR